MLLPTSRSSALIGHSGFVGSNLASQSYFTDQFNSKNIQDICGRTYDIVVCAGIQAKKWWANKNPEADWSGIVSLLNLLRTVRTSQFILISTIDVYANPSGVDEDTDIDPEINHAYGKHRFYAEEFVRETFHQALIMRLPGLFGSGIKKNVIHDLIHGHELGKVNPLGEYQYYYLDRLTSDIDKALEMGIALLNLSAAPILTREIKAEFFPNAQIGPESEFRVNYNMLSKYWRQWDSTSQGYLYDKCQVTSQLKNFIQRSLASLQRTSNPQNAQ